MTTATWSSRIRHDTDATWQEWRDEFITKLGIMVAAGKLAADETNITPAVGARPGTSTEGGYAVYHLSDSIHSTAPVYIRFGFGTDSGATSPRIQITVGTSTNGSGVLGGTALSTIASLTQNQAQTTDTVRSSYMCAVAGYLGFSWKQGSGNADSFFFICRTCDNTGAPTATGAHLWMGGQGNITTKSQAFRYAATAAAYTAQSGITQSMLGFLPQAQTSTLTGGNIQVAVGWSINPSVCPIFGVCGVLDSEVGTGVTFSVAVVGSTPRTYLSLQSTGTGAGSFGPQAPSTTFPKFAMLYE